MIRIRKAFAATALVLLSILTGTAPTLAQSVTKLSAPPSITYQGSLADSKGAAPEDGVYTMNFRLYGDAEGSDVLWEHAFSVQVTDGVFNVLLGSAEAPLPSSDVLDRQVWLGLQINGAVEMRPYTPLTASPTAINVVDEAITTKKLRDGAVTAEKIGTDYVSGVTVDGKRITGKGGELNLRSSGGLEFSFDSVSNQLEVGLSDELTGTIRKGSYSEVLADLTVNGKLTVIGNTVLGNSTSHTIAFNGVAATNLNMNQYSLKEVSTLEMGKVGVSKGQIDFFNNTNNKKVRVNAASPSVDRVYTIPDVGTNANFLMNAGDQHLDGTLTLSGSVIPQFDNTTVVGSTDNRVADIYLGTGSLHLASTSDETVVARDWSTGIIIEDSAAGEAPTGSYQIKEGGVKLVTVSPNTGDVLVSGEVSSAGLTTSGDIQLTTDDTYAIGTPEYRVADIYLGTGSLHLASTSDETVVSRDWSTGIILEDSATMWGPSGAYQVKEGGVQLMTIAPTTGDMKLAGEIQADGFTSWNDIQFITDDAYAIGTPDARVADIYLGTGSLHLASTSDETVVSRDWSTGIIVEDSVSDTAPVGSYQIKEGGVKLMTIAPTTGDMLLSGEVQSAGLTTSGDIQLTSDDTYAIGTPEYRVADIYLGTGSLHLASTSDETIVARDWSTGIIVEDSVSDTAPAGSFQIKEGGVKLMTISPTTGDMLLSGTVQSGGLVTSGDIELALDDQYTIGTPEARLGDIYVGTGSVHFVSTEEETGDPTDWSFGIATEANSLGAPEGSLVIRQAGDVLAAVDLDGNVLTSGKMFSTSTIEEDPGTTLTTKNYVDAALSGLESDLGSMASQDADGVDITGGVATLTSLKLGNTAGDPSRIRFYEPNTEESLNDANYTSFVAAEQDESIEYTLPAAQGSNGDVLSNNGEGVLSWTNPTNTSWGLQGNAIGKGSIFVGTTNAEDLVLKTNSVERMRILETGEVGIGGTPDATLQVSGAGHGNFYGYPSLLTLTANDQNAWALMLQNEDSIGNGVGMFLGNDGTLNVMNDEGQLMYTASQDGILASQVGIAAPEMRFVDELYGGATTTLRVNPLIEDDYTLTLPSAQGSSGDVLTTDGEGNLSWLDLGAMSQASIHLNSEMVYSDPRPTVSASLIPGEINATTGGAASNLGILRLSAGGGTDVITKTYIDLTGDASTEDADRNIVLGTRGTEKMRITATGDVGINESIPDATLHVAGTGHFEGRLTLDDQLAIGTTAPVGTLDIAGSGHGDVMGYPALVSLRAESDEPWGLVLSNDATEDSTVVGMWLANDGAFILGKVSIDRHDPEEIGDFVESPPQAITDLLAFAQDGSVAIGAGAPLTISSTGNVGIGTIPERALDVSGDIRASSTASFSGSITSVGGAGPVAFSPDTVANRYFLWLADQSAVRGGLLEANVEDNFNFGTLSVGFGYNPRPTGTASVAIGHNSVSHGQYSGVLSGHANYVHPNAEASAILGGDSHVIVGPYSAIGGGLWNDLRASRSTISGGGYNEINASDDAVIGGGNGNYIYTGSTGATIAGGSSNGIDETATGAVISGGTSNYVESQHGTIGGGTNNEVYGLRASILGGSGNSANGDYATIGGGLNNSADGLRSAVVGGSNNGADGNRSIIGGGDGNDAWGDYTVIGGGEDNWIDADYSVIGGGQGNGASGDFSVISGGVFNSTGEDNAVVAGGYSNDANGLSSAVGGGSNNAASGIASVIAGGNSNTVTGDYAFVGGGASNGAFYQHSVVAGGNANRADGDRAAVGGGWQNHAGEYSAIPGGRHLVLGGSSFGYNATSANGQIDLSTYSNIAYFGNTNLWIGNSDSTPRELRFYAANDALDFDGAHYTAFKAGSQSDDITYQLPSSQGGSNTVLTNNGSGVLSWQSVEGGGSGWSLTGNSITEGDFIGTTNNTELVLKANNIEGLTISTGGEVITNDLYSGNTSVSGTLEVGEAASFASAIIAKPYDPEEIPAATLPTGDGPRFMWVPEKSALRVGKIESGSDEWDDAENFGEASIALGSNSRAYGDRASVLGGYFGLASGDYAVVGGGNQNNAANNYAFVGGGQTNTASGAYSAIAGGNGNTAGQLSAVPGGGYLTLGDNSFGFNVLGSLGNKVDLSASANIAYLGGVNLWIGNTDSSARELRFYEPNDAMNYASANYTAFKATGQSSDITYTLPSTQGSMNSVLSNDGSGNLTWSTSIASAWGRSGNSGTNASTEFVGTTDDVALNFRVNDARALRLEPNATSPNVIGGFSSNNVTSGALGATVSGGGRSSASNRVTDDYGTVGGGLNNRAGDNSGTTSDAPSATVNGGMSNTASGEAATVGGGQFNTATKTNATVGGGNSNAATEFQATVGGGTGNTASGDGSVVAGGSNSRASGLTSTVGGGLFNLSSGQYAVASGGQRDSAIGDYSAIGGGLRNATNGNYSAIPGGSYLHLGTRSFGFNSAAAASYTELGSVSDIAYLGNVDLWLGNVTGSAKAIRFYEPNSALDYSGANYTAFRAGVQENNYLLTLPTTQGNQDEVLATDGDGNLYWQPMGWTRYGNAGTDYTENYLGTSDDEALSIRTNGQERILVGTNGSVTVQEDLIVAGDATFTEAAYFANGLATTLMAVEGGEYQTTIRGNEYQEENITYYLPATQGDGGTVLTTDASGYLSWQEPSAQSWSLTGNTGLDASENFIGSQDSSDLTFRTSNEYKLRLRANNEMDAWTQTFSLRAPQGTDDVVPELRFYAEDSRDDYIGIRAPIESSTYQLVLPTFQGGAGQVLTNNGEGGLYWEDLPTEQMLGTMASQDASSVTITGGSIDVTSLTTGTLDVNGLANLANGGLEITGGGGNTYFDYPTLLTLRAENDNPWSLAFLNDEADGDGYTVYLDQQGVLNFGDGVALPSVMMKQGGEVEISDLVTNTLLTEGNAEFNSGISSTSGYIPFTVNDNNIMNIYGSNYQAVEILSLLDIYGGLNMNNAGISVSSDDFGDNQVPLYLSTEGTSESNMYRRIASFNDASLDATYDLGIDQDSGLFIGMLNDPANHALTIGNNGLVQVANNFNTQGFASLEGGAEASSMTVTGSSTVNGTLSLERLSEGTAEMLFYGSAGGNGNFISLSAPGIVDETYGLTLPDGPGDEAAVLRTSSSGQLSWGPTIRRAVETVDVTSIDANGVQVVTFTVTGAELGATAYVSPAGALPNPVTINYARVSAADTVEIKLSNHSPAPVDPPSMDWFITVIK